eukprot:2361584-Pleurochrysis_carterae.AAC.1
MWAFEWTASLLALRQSSHATLRANVAHASGASRLHCGSSLMVLARRWLKRACSSSAVIAAPLDDSRLPCVTTAGDVATGVLAAGTTNTPTLSNGTTCPPVSVSDDDPVVASTFKPTCASVASRPRLMRLWNALSIGRAQWDVHTASVFGCRRAVGGDNESVVGAYALPFTARETFVMQRIPAPVSLSHIVLALEAAIVGIDCMTEVNIACVSVSPRTCAKWSLNAATPRVMSAMITKRTLHIASPCGAWCLISAARASPRLSALTPALIVWHALLMRVYVDGCEDVLNIIAMITYDVRGYSFMRRRVSLAISVDFS